MSEKEYIERNDLIKNLNTFAPECYNALINHLIMKQPAADVVEVVRCKDCKHYDKEYHQCKLHSEEPDQYSTGFIFCMQEDDFCSYGERKEFDNDT